ncbi:hypothetical protein NMG60_11004249 [Bertholletia excelsa]
MEKTAAAIIMLEKRWANVFTLALVSIFICTALSCWIVTLLELYHWLTFLLRVTLQSLFRSWKRWSRRPKPETKTPANHATADKKIFLLREEVEMVMEKLGIFYNPDGDELQERLGPDDVVDMFGEKEPCLEELREAFEVFDENCDGFIDAGELESVLSRLGFVGASQEDCQRMIKAFDGNGDGGIDFCEFLRLLDTNI